MITGLLGKQKGGSVVTENRKGRITDNFGRIQTGGTQICWENIDKWGGGGIAKVIKCYQGDHFSEVTFKGGIG